MQGSSDSTSISGFLGNLYAQTATALTSSAYASFDTVCPRATFRRYLATEIIPPIAVTTIAVTASRYTGHYVLLAFNGTAHNGSIPYESLLFKTGETALGALCMLTGGLSGWGIKECCYNPLRDNFNQWKSKEEAELTKSLTMMEDGLTAKHS